ncbi:MAG: glutaredoxin 3, partial [Pseudomonas alloputida]
MSPVTIYTTPHCPYCLSAKRLLSNKGITPDEINVEASPLHLAEMMQRSQRRTVPQIFVGKVHVGGF